jgi:hypothetical protein
MSQYRKFTICSIALATIWSLACAIQIAAAKPPADAQGLWVADANHISEFQGAALASSGTPHAHLTFGIKPPFRFPFSIAFDQHNDLWITNHGGLKAGDISIVEVRGTEIASLRSGGVAKRRLIVPSGPGIKNFRWFGLGFDAADDLFVSNGRQLLEVRPEQLERKNPSPAIVISSMQWSPGTLRFDSSDNLWVSANNQLWKFAPNDRTANGAPNPSLIVNLPSNFGVQDLAFDGSGNLWIAGADFTVGILDEVEMISAGDLAGAGEISPPFAVTITSSAFGTEPGLPGGICLGGLDFDHSGDLWISAHCDPNTHLIEFTPSQLSIGGNLTPAVTISPNSKKTNLVNPGPIRFGPTIK